MKKFLLFLGGIFIFGCADKPSDSLIVKQLDFYRLFGEVRNFKKLDEYKEKNYYVVELSFDLYVKPDLIKENLKLFKEYEPEIAEKYRFLIKKLEKICGTQVIKKGKACKIKDKFKFVKGYSNWYRVFNDDKLEGAQLR